MILFGAVASGALKSFIKTVDISGPSVNLRSLADAAGFRGQKIVQLTLVGTAYAQNTSSYGLIIGSWPNGTRLSVVFSANVFGYGGAGGSAGIAQGYQPGGYGAAGGPAVLVSAGISGGSITFIAGGGGIYAGGGGGGGGGSRVTQFFAAQEWKTYYANGGYGGTGAGAQGAATVGTGGQYTNSSTVGGNGGPGGSYGAAGGAGGGTASAGGGGGGAGGAAIVNSSLVSLQGWAQGTNLFGYLG